MHYIAALVGRNVVLGVLEADFPKSAARRRIARSWLLDGPALNVRAPGREGERHGGGRADGEGSPAAGGCFLSREHAGQ